MVDTASLSGDFCERGTAVERAASKTASGKGSEEEEEVRTGGGAVWGMGFPLPGAWACTPSSLVTSVAEKTNSTCRRGGAAAAAKNVALNEGSEKEEENDDEAEEELLEVTVVGVTSWIRTAFRFSTLVSSSREGGTQFHEMALLLLSASGRMPTVGPMMFNVTCFFFFSPCGVDGRT